MKAAENGNAVAQYSVGQMYFYGEGVERDLIDALCWYKRAVKNGYNAK